MPDMREPYAYIEEEIERLKVSEKNAFYESNQKRLEGEVYQASRMHLERALDQQKKSDAEA